METSTTVTQTGYLLDWWETDFLFLHDINIFSILFPLFFYADYIFLFSGRFYRNWRCQMYWPERELDWSWGNWAGNDHFRHLRSSDIYAFAELSRFTSLVWITFSHGGVNGLVIVYTLLVSRVDTNMSWWENWFSINFSVKIHHLLHFSALARAVLVLTDKDESFFLNVNYRLRLRSRFHMSLTMMTAFLFWSLNIIMWTE